MTYVLNLKKWPRAKNNRKKRSKFAKFDERLKIMNI